MENFSLLVMIITLVGGLAMHSTNIMLEEAVTSNSNSTSINPLNLQDMVDRAMRSNLTSLDTKKEIEMYLFKLDAVTVLNMTCFVLIAIAYLYFTFKYVSVKNVSQRIKSNKLVGSNVHRSRPNRASETDNLEMHVMINPILNLPLHKAQEGAVSTKINPLSKMVLFQSSRKLAKEIIGNEVMP